MSTEFTVGELVDITVKGARVTNTYPVSRLNNDRYQMLVADYSEGEARSIAVNLNASAVSVTRAAPPNWPPLVGDIWADQDDDEWIVTAPHDDGPVRLSLIDADRSSFRTPDEMDDLWPLRLVRRREVPHA